MEFPGAIYHVLSRGDRREVIFKDDADGGLDCRAAADGDKEERGGQAAPVG
jgi:hypothetical protein